MKLQQDIFEVSLVGAHGYAAVTTPLYATLQGSAAQEITLLPQGTGFEIMAQQGDCWQVRTASHLGFVQHGQCFLNLPEVMPSIVYQNTNAEACVMQSSGRNIPGITGEQLYSSRSCNARLGRAEYEMPVLYCTAYKIARAQKLARQQGDCLVIYELFRPQAVQNKIVTCLEALAQKDPFVKEGITASPWEVDWFIAQGVSTHQKGMAMDVGLARVDATENRTLPSGESYQAVTAYTIYPMHTPIHELSRASASLAHPVTSYSATAWCSVPDAPQMAQGALQLRQYCVEAGLTPLASEWWHFNDLEAVQLQGSEHFVLPNRLT